MENIKCNDRNGKTIDLKDCIPNLASPRRRKCDSPQKEYPERCINLPKTPSKKVVESKPKKEPSKFKKQRQRRYIGTSWPEWVELRKDHLRMLEDTGRKLYIEGYSMEDGIEKLAPRRYQEERKNLLEELSDLRNLSGLTDSEKDKAEEKIIEVFGNKETYYQLLIVAIHKGFSNKRIQRSLPQYDTAKYKEEQRIYYEEYDKVQKAIRDFTNALRDNKVVSNAKSVIIIVNTTIKFRSPYDMIKCVPINHRPPDPHRHFLIRNLMEFFELYLPRHWCEHYTCNVLKCFFNLHLETESTGKAYRRLKA